jgi:integrase
MGCSTSPPVVGWLTARCSSRQPHKLRTREHLTAAEVESLIEAARGNRHGHRDTTTNLLAYRHGLRAIELVDLEWSQVDFKAAVLHVHRAKKGTPATHPLRGDQMRALRKLRRESAALPDPVGGGFVASLARPDGNTTGFGGIEYSGFLQFEYSLSGRWLGLLN